jgi:hypothetical protein
MQRTELKSKRSVLLCSQNKLLFEQLDKVGLFTFYSNNSGQIIGVSQVVAFLFCGGLEAMQKGFDSDNLEVHHINGDVTDNSPENLVFLSKEDHDYVSRCTFTPYFGRVQEQGSTPFNKQGRPITNAMHFLVNILQETVAAVSAHRSGKAVVLSYAEVLLNLPSTLWNAPLHDRLPKWMTQPIMLALRPPSTQS